MESGYPVCLNEKQEENPGSLAINTNLDENNTGTAQNENFSLNAIDDAAREAAEELKCCVIREKLEEKDDIPEERIVEISDVDIEIILIILILY